MNVVPYHWSLQNMEKGPEKMIREYAQNDKT
jgi:hypothetical protein